MPEIKMKTVNPIAVEHRDGGYDVKLPESVGDDLEVMRKVAHRMVDEVADRGLLSWLLHTVENNLGTLADDIIGEFVLSLVNEATGKKEVPAKPVGPANIKTTLTCSNWVSDADLREGVETLRKAAVGFEPTK